MNDKKMTKVRSKEGFRNAIDAGYETIEIEGTVAQEIASSLRKNDAARVGSSLACIAGIFFWPAAIIGLGGFALTSKMKKYEIINVEDNRVVIQKKKKK